MTAHVDYRICLATVCQMSDNCLSSAILSPYKMWIRHGSFKQIYAVTTNSVVTVSSITMAKEKFIQPCFVYILILDLFMVLAYLKDRERFCRCLRDIWHRQRLK